MAYEMASSLRNKRVAFIMLHTMQTKVSHALFHRLNSIFGMVVLPCGFKTFLGT